MAGRASVPSIEDLQKAGANQATIEALKDLGMVKRDGQVEKVYKVKGGITKEMADKANELLAAIKLELVPWRD